jgi:hypothetical protein
MKKILFIVVVFISTICKSQSLIGGWLAIDIFSDSVYSPSTIFTFDSIGSNYVLTNNIPALDTVKPGDSISFCISIQGESDNSIACYETFDSVTDGNLGAYNVLLWGSYWNDKIDTFSWSEINEHPIYSNYPNERIDKIVCLIPDTLKLDTVDLSKDWYYITFGCGTKSQPFFIWPPKKDTVIKSGINEISNKLISNVFPNPNNGVFIVSFPKKYIVEIYNELGELVYNGFTNSPITIRSPAGMYYYKITTKNGNQIETGKFIIQ